MKSSIHRGVDHDRIDGDQRVGDLERVLAEAWEELNEDPDSFGIATIVASARRELSPGLFNRQVLARDAAMAATAVQWLGTPVGTSWLRKVFKKAGWLVLHETERSAAGLRWDGDLGEPCPSRLAVDGLHTTIGSIMSDVGPECTRCGARTPTYRPTGRKTRESTAGVRLVTLAD